jgi:hypothetical protein
MININVESLLNTNKVLDAELSTGILYGTNTGDGTVASVTAPISTVTEDWTLTCTAATVDGGTFSVIGSVSGAQADATVGVAYDNGFVAFTITDGVADWVVGDTITISIVRNITAYKTTDLSVLQVDIAGDATSIGFDILSSLTGVNLYVNSSEVVTAGKLYSPSIVKANLHLIDLTSVTYTTATTITIYSL